MIMAIIITSSPPSSLRVTSVFGACGDHALAALHYINRSLTRILLSFLLSTTTKNSSTSKKKNGKTGHVCLAGCALRLIQKTSFDSMTASVRSSKSLKIPGRPVHGYTCTAKLQTCADSVHVSSSCLLSVSKTSKAVCNDLFLLSQNEDIPWLCHKTVHAFTHAFVLDKF